MSNGGNLLPKVMPISIFRRFGVIQVREFKAMLAVSYLVLQAVPRFCFRHESRFCFCSVHITTPLLTCLVNILDCALFEAQLT